MQKEILELLKKRIKDNNTIFQKEELKVVKENTKTMEKIYLLGMMDAFK